MTDIHKCAGHHCDIRESCWRFLAPATHHQSWLLNLDVGVDCEDYWPVKRENPPKEES